MANEKRGGWWRRIFRKLRISISNPETARESWYTHISPVGIGTALTALTFIIFGILLLLVAYTPLLDMLPGYRTDASKSRETLVRSLIRIDSLERKMNDMLIYNENRILVVDGKTPTMRTVQNDTTARNKQIVPPSKADSLFRRQMENDNAYALNTSTSNTHSNISAVKPLEGIIAERFNAKVGLYGIRIASTPSSQVVAIAAGTVTAADWIPDSGNCITIQHDGGMTSVYRRMSSTIATKGQRVASGEVIGYSSEEEGDTLFEFELWMGGKPLDPEAYIIF